MCSAIQKETCTVKKTGTDARKIRKRQTPLQIQTAFSQTRYNKQSAEELLLVQNTTARLLHSFHLGQSILPTCDSPNSSTMNSNVMPKIHNSQLPTLLTPCTPKSFESVCKQIHQAKKERLEKLQRQTKHSVRPQFSQSP
jgi:hypothetical protein